MGTRTISSKPDFAKRLALLPGTITMPADAEPLAALAQASVRGHASMPENDFRYPILHLHYRLADSRRAEALGEVLVEEYPHQHARLAAYLAGGGPTQEKETEDWSVRYRRGNVTTTVVEASEMSAPSAAVPVPPARAPSGRASLPAVQAMAVVKAGTGASTASASHAQDVVVAGKVSSVRAAVVQPTSEPFGVGRDEAFDLGDEGSDGDGAVSLGTRVVAQGATVFTYRNLYKLELWRMMTRDKGWEEHEQRDLEEDRA
jgi:hypothetical protein